MKIAMGFLPVILGVLWLLYECGVIALQAKRAVVYIGSSGGLKAQFSGCTGSVQRILRVRESRMFRFDLDMELTRGEVYAELYTQNKCLLQLNEQNSQAEILLETGRRYRLVFRYHAAAGKHELKYQ